MFVTLVCITTVYAVNFTGESQNVLEGDPATYTLKWEMTNPSLNGWAEMIIYLDGVQKVTSGKDGKSGEISVAEGSTVRFELQRAETFYEPDDPKYVDPITKYSLVFTVDGKEQTLDGDEGKVGAYEFTMPGHNVDLVATFNKPVVVYACTMEIEGQGRIDVVPSVTSGFYGTTGDLKPKQLEENETFTVTTTADAGWQFKSLTVTMNGTAVSASTEGKYTVTGTVVIKAVFEPKILDLTVEKPVNGDLTVTFVNADGTEQTINTSEFAESTTTATAKVKGGTVLKVVPTPSEPEVYELGTLSPEMNPVTVETETYYEYTVTDNVTVTATFKEIQYGAVTVKTVAPAEDSGCSAKIQYLNGEEWADADDTYLAKVRFGTRLKVVLTTAEEHELVSVVKSVADGTEDDETLNPDSEENYFFTVDAENVTITATFKEIQYGAVTVTAPENGTLKVQKRNDTNEWVDATEEDLGKVRYTTELRAVVAPSDDYEVDKVTMTVGEDVTDLTLDPDGNYYFRVNADALTISATFKAVQYGDVTVTPVDEKEGSVEVQSYDPETYEWTKLEGAALEHLRFGTQLRVVATPAANYEVESVKLNDEPLTYDEEEECYYFVVEAEAVTITVTFKQSEGSSIDSVSDAGVYYSAAEEVLYTAGAASVKVYDLAGCVVMSAENVESLNVSSLAGGVYVAVVDGVAVKFSK